MSAEPEHTHEKKRVHLQYEFHSSSHGWRNTNSDTHRDASGAEKKDVRSNFT